MKGFCMKNTNDDRRRGRIARRAFSLALVLALLLNTVGFAAPSVTRPVAFRAERDVDTEYVESRVGEKEAELDGGPLQEGGALPESTYFFEFGEEKTVLLSEIFAFYKLSAAMAEVETVLLPGGDALSASDLLYVEALTDANQAVFDYRITALQYFDEARLSVNLPDAVYTLVMSNPSSEQPEAELPYAEEETPELVPTEQAEGEIEERTEVYFEEKNDDDTEEEQTEVGIVETRLDEAMDAALNETDETEPDDIALKDDETDATGTEDIELPDDEMDAAETEDVELPDDETDAAETETVELTDDETDAAETEAVKLPEDETDATETETVELTNEEAEASAPALIVLADEGAAYEDEYLRLAPLDGAATLRAAEPEAPEHLRVEAAYAIEDGAGVAVALIDTPELAEGEYLALYGLDGAALSDAPLADHWIEGDGATVSAGAWDGFALVRLGLTAYQQLPAESLGEATVELSGTLPVSATVAVESVDALEAEPDVVASCDISILDAADNAFAPLEGQPIEVTLRSEAIRAANEAGSALSVVMVSEDFETDSGVELISAEGDAVTFAVDSCDAFAVREIVLEKDQTVSDGSTYKITATYDTASGIPEGASLEVRELDEAEYRATLAKAAPALGEQAGDVSIARAFDISFVKDGVAYHALSGEVQIGIQLMDREVTEDMQVVHLGDTPELLETTVEGDTLSFASDSFSVYVIVDGVSRVTPRRFYHFLGYSPADENSEYAASRYEYADDSGANVNVQIVKDGDSLVEPPTPDDILAAEGDDIIARFFGWYIIRKTPRPTDMEDAKLDGDSDLNFTYTWPNDAERLEFGVIDVDEDKDYDYYIAPLYENSRFILFHEDIYGGDNVHRVMSRKLVDLPTSGEVQILMTDVRAPLQRSEHEYFYAWELRDAAGTVQETYAAYDENGEATSTSMKVTREKFAQWGERYEGSVENTALSVYPVYATSYWLFFDGGDKASYTEAKFLTTGTKLASLPVPTREGYVFDGWFTANGERVTDDEGKLVADGTSFTDGSVAGGALVLGNDVTLHAHWNAVATAQYRVVIWRQKVTDGKNSTDAQKSYDYVEYYTSNPVSTSAGVSETMLRSFTGTDSDGKTVSKMNLEGFSYTGFSYSRNDAKQAGNVKPDGSTVINVYYDRKLITLNFNTYSNRTWSQYRQFTGLYGQTLAQNDYTWPTEYDWYDNKSGNSATGTRTTFLDGFLPTSDTTTLNYYAASTSSGKTIYFYKQKADGSGYDLANTVGTNSSAFNISDKYNGFTAESYSTDGTTWTNVGELMQSDNSWYYDADPNKSGYQTASIGSNGLHIRFKRNRSSIVYMYGSTEIGSVDNIYYEAGLADYNYDYTWEGFKWPETLDTEHYEFKGWYTDAALSSSRYTFTKTVDGKTVPDTMPAADKVVYAKWEPKKYLVQVDPRGGEINETDSTWFYVTYGEKIGQYIVSRNYVEDNDEGTYYYHYDAYDPEGDPNSDSYKGVEYGRRSYYSEEGSGSQKYRPEANAYSLVGWYETATNKPYSFGKTVDGPVSIYALWRRTGTYIVRYESVDPEGRLADEIHIDPVDGDLEAGKGFTDSAAVTAIDAPSNYDKSKYIFEGWQIIDKFNHDEPVTRLMSPGDPFVVDASHAYSDNVIYAEAVFKEIEESARVPVTVNLVLDSNEDAKLTGTVEETEKIKIYTDGEINEGDTLRKTGLNQGVYFLDQQDNVAVPLDEYSAKFTHDKGYRLLGWDAKSKKDSMIPDFYANQSIGVDRADVNNVLYAIWEPQVYVKLVNNTEEALTDIALEIPGWTQGQLFRVNEAAEGYESYAREAFEAFEDGKATFDLDVGETLCLVLPDGANMGFSVSGVNGLEAGKRLIVDTSVSGGHSAAYPGEDYLVSDTMRVSDTPVTVTFTKETYPTTAVVDVKYFNVDTDGKWTALSQSDGTYYWNTWKTSLSLSAEPVNIADALKYSNYYGVAYYYRSNYYYIQYTAYGVGGASEQVEYASRSADKTSTTADSWVKFEKNRVYWSPDKVNWTPYEDAAVYVLFSTLQPVTVTVKKVVNGSDADKGRKFKFQAKVTGTNNWSRDFELSDSETANITLYYSSSKPDSVTITEVDSGDAFTDSAFTLEGIADDNTAAGTVNLAGRSYTISSKQGTKAQADTAVTFTNKRLTDSLTVKKDVENANNDATPFTFVVTLDETVPEGWAQDGVTVSTDRKHLTFALSESAGGLKLENLPKGMGYAIAETVDSGYKQKGAENATGTVDGGTAVFTNTKKTPLTLTVKDAEYKYDGTAKTGRAAVDFTVYGVNGDIDTDDYNVTGLRFGDVLSVLNYSLPTATEAGTEEGSFNNAKLSVTRDGVDVTDEYVISTTPGKLTINVTNITVTVIGDSKTVSYIGERQVLTGYSYTVKDTDSGETLPNSAVSVSIPQEKQTARGIVEGQYGMEMNADSVEVTASSSYNVTKVVYPGILTITRAKVVITVKDKVVPYNGAAQSGHALPGTLTGVAGGRLETEDYTVEGLANGDILTVEYAPTEGTDAGEYGAGSFAGSVVIKRYILDDETEAQVLTVVTGSYTVQTNPGSLTIEQLDVTVTADDKTKVYGDPDPELTYSVIGALDGDTVDYSLSRVPGEDVGPHDIEISGRTDQGNYRVNYVGGTLTITPKAVTVKADDLSKTYGDADPELTATAEGVLSGDTLEYTVSRAAGEDVDTYTVTPSGAEEQGNYTVSYETGTFTINPKAVSVTANSWSKTYGEDDPALTATVEGVLNGDTVAYTVSRAAGEDAGAYDITPSGAEAQGNYQVSYYEGKLTIWPRVTLSVTMHDFRAKDEGVTLSFSIRNNPYPSFWDKTVVVKDDETVSVALENVPTDANLIFDEPATDIYDVTTTYNVTPADATGVGNTLVIHCDYMLRLTTLRVEKIVESAASYEGYHIPVNDDAQFDFSVTFDPALPGSAKAGPGVTLSADRKTASFKLQNNGSAELEDIPAGTKYAVSETSKDGYTTIIPDNAQGMASAEETTVRFTNQKPQPLVITVKDAEYRYDGAEKKGRGISRVSGITTDINTDDYTVARLAAGDILRVQYNAPAQTQPGSYTGSFDQNSIKVTRDNEDVTDKYDITLNPGKLVISENDIVVTVTGSSATGVYSGERQSVTGYTYAVTDKETGAALDDSLVSVSVSEANQTAAGVNAGSYTMNMTDATVTVTPVMGYKVTEVVINPGKLTITPKAVTVTADDLFKTYGEADPELTATVEGTLGEDKDKIEYTVTRAEGEDVGKYAITASGEKEQGNYTVSYAPGTFTIVLKMVTVKVDKLSKTYGEADPELTATVEGALDEDKDEIKYTVTRAEGEDVGEYAVTVSGEAEQGNYTVAYEMGTFTIYPKVTLTKVLKDAYAEGSETFSFTLTLLDSENAPMEGHALVEDSVVTDENGTATVELGNGDSLDLTLPMNATLSIQESAGAAEYITETSLDSDVTRGSEVTLEPNINQQDVIFTNIRPICKIKWEGVEYPFVTLNEALAFVTENIESHQAKIEMLVDYAMPENDRMIVPEGYDITMTTASATEGKYRSKVGTAVIARGHSGDNMLVIQGALTLTNITLNGGAYTGGAVSVATGANATLKDGTTITGFTDAEKGAFETNAGSHVYLSGNVVIDGNTNTEGRAANLYLGADDSTIIHVNETGLGENALVGIKATDFPNHNNPGDQFATATNEAINTLDHFVNDDYGYKGKQGNVIGSFNAVIWRGNDLTITKLLTGEGTQSGDSFTVEIHSKAITRSSTDAYSINDYDLTKIHITPTNGDQPGVIEIQDLKSGSSVAMHDLPWGEYIIEETGAGNYEPAMTAVVDGGEPRNVTGGALELDGNCAVTITNRRKTAVLHFSKTLHDVEAKETAHSFNFVVKITERDGQRVISSFTLQDADEEVGTAAVKTDGNGSGNFSLSLKDGETQTRDFSLPVGAVVTVTETVQGNYEMTGTLIGAEDTDADDNAFTFVVPDGEVTLALVNNRKQTAVNVTKQVAKGLFEAADEPVPFGFTAKLTQGKDEAEVSVVGWQLAEGLVTDENGEVRFTLNASNTVQGSRVLNVPFGYNLTVTEDEASLTGDIDGASTVVYTAAPESRSLSLSNASVLEYAMSFTNTRNTQKLKVVNSTTCYSGYNPVFNYEVILRKSADGEVLPYSADAFTDGKCSFTLNKGANREILVPVGAYIEVRQTGVTPAADEIYLTEVAGPDQTRREADEIQFAFGNVDSTVTFYNTQWIKLVLENLTEVDMSPEVYIAQANRKIVNGGEIEDVTPVGEIGKLNIPSGGKVIVVVPYYDNENYTVSGNGRDGYYLTIVNEPAYHEDAQPALAHAYNENPFSVQGRLRYSPVDSTVTFTEQPLVTFDPNNGRWTVAMEERYHRKLVGQEKFETPVEKGQAVAMPEVSPIYVDAPYVTFAGWTADAEAALTEAGSPLIHSDQEDLTDCLYDFETAVNAPLTLYALWVRETVKIEYNFGEGSWEDPGLPDGYALVTGENTYRGRAFRGDALEAPENDPIQAGYGFLGWTADESLAGNHDFDETTMAQAKAALYDFNAIVDGDLTLYAVYGATVSVTFDLTNGHTWNTANSEDYYRSNEDGTQYIADVIKGDVVRMPRSPIGAAGAFYRWTTSDAFKDKVMAYSQRSELTDAFDFSQPITEPITLYTSWVDADKIEVAIVKADDALGMVDKNRAFTFNYKVVETEYAEGEAGEPAIEEGTLTAKVGEPAYITLYAGSRTEPDAVYAQALEIKEAVPEAYTLTSVTWAIDDENAAEAAIEASDEGWYHLDAVQMSEAQDSYTRLDDDKGLTVTFHNQRGTAPLVVENRMSSAVEAAFDYTLTLTDGGRAAAGYQLSASCVTDATGQASFRLNANQSVTLSAPVGAKLAIVQTAREDYAVEAVSSEYADADAETNAFTVEAVGSYPEDSAHVDGKADRIAFVNGVCKITGGDQLLEVEDGGRAYPALYATLGDAFAAYIGAFKDDRTPTHVRMLVDDYYIQKSETYIVNGKNTTVSTVAFPAATMTLTTANKDDARLPYIGVRDRAVINRYAPGGNSSCFTITSKDSDITLTNIVLDGGMVLDASGNNVGVSAMYNCQGGLINMSAGTLNIYEGSTLRNSTFAWVSDGNWARGGAIYANGGSINVKNALFMNCYARAGGAIYADKGVDLNIIGDWANGEAGTRFVSCYASYGITSGGDRGGAIYKLCNDGDTVLIDGGKASVVSDDGQIDAQPETGVAFIDCQSYNNNGMAGALYIEGNGSANTTTTGLGTATIQGVSFVRCIAYRANTDNWYGGGGIFANNMKKVVVMHCAFDHCDAMGSGGGALLKGEDCYVEDCGFDVCNTARQGGGLATYPLNMATATYIRGVATLVNCSFKDTSSGTGNGSGGGFQTYMTENNLTNCHFSNCWAGKEGGAINHFYADGADDTKIWDNTTMMVTGCTFEDCRSEDRYLPNDVHHHGGAISTKAKTVVIKGSTFTNCKTNLREGGAVILLGCNEGSTAEILGSVFTDCYAKVNGGAIAARTYELSVKDTQFIRCATNGGGGAIMHGDVANQSRASSKATIESCSFVDCSAANGGAIYSGSSVYENNVKQSMVIEGGYIENCKATNGSAVYVYNNNIVTFKDAALQENTCSALIGGAVQVNANSAELYFGGDTVVRNNTCSADATGTQHNVILNFDTNNVIRTTEEGLSENADIGVYVNHATNANIYNKHGKVLMPFGFHGDSEKSRHNLNRFVNDRNPELFGARLNSDLSDTQIYWGNFVCKITDEDGNTLIRPDGQDAVYISLEGAFREYERYETSPFTYSDGRVATPAYVKLLVGEYGNGAGNVTTTAPTKTVILTTAGENDPVAPSGVEYNYRGESGTNSIIHRGGNTNTPIITVPNDTNAHLILENITFDGRIYNDDGSKTEKSIDGNGALVCLNGGKITVRGGTVIQYGQTNNSKHGGAIYSDNTASTVEVISETASDKILFLNCSSVGHGGAIFSKGALKVEGKTSKSGDKSIRFENCTGRWGGAVSSQGTDMTVKNASFTDCSSQSEGGAVYHDNEGNYTTTVSGCVFTRCNDTTTSSAYGGAIGSKAMTLIVEHCRFVDCYANSNGGAINHGCNKSNRGVTILTDNQFNNCYANSSGGAVYSQAKQVSITGNTFVDCWANSDGGALHIKNNPADIEITDCGFENCYSQSGAGGVLECQAMTLEVTDTTFDNCHSLGDGGGIRDLNTNSGTELTLRGCTFKDIYSGSPTQTKWGGAIDTSVMKVLVEDSEKNTTLFENCVVLDGSGQSSHGGAICIHSNSKQEVTIRGNASFINCSADRGGAIYLRSNNIVYLEGSLSFINNGHNEKCNASAGAAIYVEQGSQLHMQGELNFGGNYVTSRRVTNGGVNGYARQDIYLAGYSGNTVAQSIWVDGELTGNAIYVWPENDPHRLVRQIGVNNKWQGQFAKITASDPSTVSDATLAVFRNALDDETTKCDKGEFLAGMRETTSDNNIYWGLSADASFTKKDTDGFALSGAQFTLYRNSAYTSVYTSKVSADGVRDIDADGNPLAKGMVKFENLPVGVYYMKETQPPKNFEENKTKYLMLVGFSATAYDADLDVWQTGGALHNAAADDVCRASTVTIDDREIYCGIFAIGEDGNADISVNLARTGIENLATGVCKLTDMDGNLLYCLSNGGNQIPAVYRSLKLALEAAANADTKLFRAEDDGYVEVTDDSRINLKAQMIVANHAIKEPIVIEGSVNVTLTTASRDDTLFPFDSEDSEVTLSTVVRDEDSTSTEPLITSGIAGLTLTGITLDGQSIATSANGGLIAVSNGGTVTVDEGATLINACAAKGGAVYVLNGGSLNVKGGEITDNTVTAVGAGVYVAEGGAVKLSGKPNFGGTGVKADGTQDKTAGNFADGDLTNATNGGMEYTAARQDIFIAGKGEPISAVVLTGNLDVDNGSIWVWAEEAEHHYMLNQFAVVDPEGFEKSEDGKPIISEETFMAFRNARDDETTGCGGDYLTGQSGEDINGRICVYWTGGFDFVFRKIDGFGDVLEGATFKLYLADKTTGAKTDTTYKRSGSDVESAYLAEGEEVKIKVNIGTATAPNVQERTVYGGGLVKLEKIPPATYYLFEAEAPKLDPDDTSSDPVKYQSAEAMYKVVLDPKGFVTFYVAGEDGNWTTEAPKVTFTEDNTGTETTLGKFTFKPETTKAENPGTVDIYTILNLDPRERKVILRKVEEDTYASLEGAKFEILRVDGTKLSSTDINGDTTTTFTSGASGVYFIDKLPYGIYYLHETQAPEGYVAPTRSFEFRVDADGVSQMTEVEPEEGGEARSEWQPTKQLDPPEDAAEPDD